MDIGYLIQLLNNKSDVLSKAKDQAFMAGDQERINAIDSEIFGVQDTLNKLKLVSDLSDAANNANVTPAEVVASGLDVVQNVNSIQGPSAGAVINGYDISAYATDPLYEDKIHAILNAMPTFSVVSDVDTYIQSLTPGSPITGAMVYAAVQQYAVDLPLLVAIMQNDSSFGTLGVGSYTFNPGNVGNTGSATHTYPSWDDGVNAVADWLNRHRVVTPVDDTTSTDPTTPTDTQTNANAATVVNAVPTTVPPVTTPAPIPDPVLPTTPIVPVVTAATFIVPTANATTTPITIPTDTATTTPTVDVSDDTTATSTATSTDATTDDTATSASTTDDTATSTPDVVVDPTPDTSSASTTIPVIHLDDTSDSTTTPDSILQSDATSTLDVTATSTQANAGSSKKKRTIA